MSGKSSGGYLQGYSGRVSSSLRMAVTRGAMVFWEKSKGMFAVWNSWGSGFVPPSAKAALRFWRAAVGSCL